MKAYLARPALWFCIILVISATQYLPVAIAATREHIPMYWSLPPGKIAAAGKYKYGKDLIIVLFSAVWPVLVGFRRSVIIYYIWLSGVLLFGTVAYGLGEGAPVVFAAGLRWLIALHAACGIYFLVLLRGITPKEQLLVLRVSAALALLSCILTIWQISAVGISHFGKARLPGMFAVGGTNGYFGLGVALMASVTIRRYTMQSMICYALSLFVAAASGTRFAFLGTGFLVYLTLIGWASRSGILTTKAHRLFTHSLFLPIGVAGGLLLSNVATQRGDVLADQTGKLGRAATLMSAIDVIESKGDVAKYAFGAGLGMGTNSAQLLLVNNSVMPDWQVLVDNTFVTTFIQFGIMGSVFLLVGIMFFLLKRIGSAGYPYLILLIVASVTQNLLEQIFILLPGALFLGFHVRQSLLRRRSPTVLNRRSPVMGTLATA